MLDSLYVKNLALIDEEEVTFTEGLNVLSGETGAGKIHFDWFCFDCTWGKGTQRDDSRK